MRKDSIYKDSIRLNKHLSLALRKVQHFDCVFDENSVNLCLDVLTATRLAALPATMTPPSLIQQLCSSQSWSISVSQFNGISTWKLTQYTQLIKSFWSYVILNYPFLICHLEGMLLRRRLVCWLGRRASAFALFGVTGFPWTLASFLEGRAWYISCKTL